MAEIFKNADLEGLIKPSWSVLSFARVSQEMDVLSKKRAIDFKIDNRIKESINVDHLKIDRVLINLIGNAFESDADEVIVKGFSQETKLYLEVWDNGKGVSEEMMSTLFQRGKSDKIGGTGLGLAFVRHVARGHGGEAFYQRRGKYSIFSIIIPGVRPISLPNVTEQQANLREKCQKKTQMDTDVRSRMEKDNLVFIRCKNEQLTRKITSKLALLLPSHRFTSEVDDIAKCLFLYTDSTEKMALAMNQGTPAMLHQPSNKIEIIINRLAQRITLLEARK